jgi:hypothetical protein
MGRMARRITAAYPQIGDTARMNRDDNATGPVVEVTPTIVPGGKVIGAVVGVNIRETGVIRYAQDADIEVWSGGYPGSWLPALVRTLPD